MIINFHIITIIMRFTLQKLLIMKNYIIVISYSFGRLAFHLELLLGKSLNC